MQHIMIHVCFILLERLDAVNAAHLDSSRNIRLRECNISCFILVAGDSRDEQISVKTPPHTTTRVFTQSPSNFAGNKTACFGIHAIEWGRIDQPKEEGTRRR